jgi:hypothetical protein
MPNLLSCDSNEVGIGCLLTLWHNDTCSLLDGIGKTMKRSFIKLNNVPTHIQSRVYTSSKLLCLISNH